MSIEESDDGELSEAFDEEGSEGCSAADVKAERSGDNQGAERGKRRSLVLQDGQYTSGEVMTESFEELVVPSEVQEELRAAWAVFLQSAESRDAAGEALLTAVFEAAPSIQGLFRTARVIIAMRFMNGLSMMIDALSDPKALKLVVETLGFQHMDIQVTSAHVAVFREATTELLSQELGACFTPAAQAGWCGILNYAGGAFIYLRFNCADRLRVLASSWATANHRRQEPSSGELSGEHLLDGLAADDAEVAGKTCTGSGSGQRGGKHRQDRGNSRGWAADDVEEEGMSGKSVGRASSIPTTYAEMFRFNAAVMGFTNLGWMGEVLCSFETIVTNAANTYRLQEECDVLSLRLARFKCGIRLSDYKAVMLASLRSLVPQDWNSAHEVAWSWLWDNVAHMLTGMIGQPARMQDALERLWARLDERHLHFLRRQLYDHFFALAPAGQDFFKQSTTRLHFISDLVRSLTLDIYKGPKQVVEDISGIGLRHVGYGIPVDLIPPFVTAWLQVIHKVTDDEVAEHAFRWSLDLIARIMKRVITEGSTIVMKAINANSGKMLQKAVTFAARGERASWMLNVQVGTQRISPFMWALESGSLEAANAIIVDLLTIRADRDHYYYAADALFERHPDVVQRLSIEAPSLLPTLLDGLIWRSRTTEKGMRRVNYYVMHLVVDASGEFSKAIEWLTDGGDPTIACHPVVSFVMDLVWSGCAYRSFLLGKTWLLFCIVVFIIAQSVFNRWEDVYVRPEGGGLDVLEDHNDLWMRVAIFGMRLFLYTCSMGRWVYHHVLHMYRDYRAGDFIPLWWKLKMPYYLGTWQNRVSLMLAFSLLAMFVQCPVLYCLGGPVDQLLAQRCEGSKPVLHTYSIASAVSMVLYFLLLTDVAVFSTRISAFVLVCGRVIPEVALFVIGILFVALTFAAAISTLEQYNPDFGGLPRSMLSLILVTLGMFKQDGLERALEYPEVLIAIIIYVLCTGIFLVNLLVAQLSCVYQSTYQDLLGYARLHRSRILVETMPRVDKPRWVAFVESLRFTEPVEFGEGDIGLAGGIQVSEPGNLNPTTADMIKRFGGSTSRAAVWPAESGGGDEEGRLERVEKIVENLSKRFAKFMQDGKRHISPGGSSTVVSSQSIFLSSTPRAGDF